MTLRRITLATTLIPFLGATAIAQTAPPSSQTIQRPQPPTLQQSIDSAEASVNRIVTDFGNNISLLANQVETMKQQLAEANQTISAKVVAINDVTKDRDATKVSLTAAEKQVADDKAVVAEQGGRIAAMTTDLAARDKTIADLKAPKAEAPSELPKSTSK